MKIAICDNDTQFLVRLKALVGQYMMAQNKPCEISLFNMPEELLNAQPNTYDFIFSESCFRFINGLLFAKQVRQKQSHATYIFVSDVSEVARKGYEVGAFRYLLKNELSFSLVPCLNDALQQKNCQQTIEIKTDIGKQPIPVSHILYIESDRRLAVFHLSQEDREKYSYYEKISVLTVQLEPLGFLRIQKSFLVNMAHIVSLTAESVVLTGNVMLPISRQNSKMVLKMYAKWKKAHRFTEKAFHDKN